MTTKFENFIGSLDPKTLPRVLQIQAGFYQEGPIYEHFGNEYSFSTDDIIKIVGFKVKKVVAHIFKGKDHEKKLDTIELPPDFPGLFKVVADETPYYSIEEITKELNIRPTHFGYPRFHSYADLNVANFTINKHEQIIFSSVKEVNGVMSANCQLTREGKCHTLFLPLAYEGEFYECQDERIYTMKEILDWKSSSSRFRSVVLSDVMGIWDVKKLYPKCFRGGMILKPVYEVQAVLQFRKDIVYLLSDLDIEVMDITQHFDMKSFIQLLTTQEIFERTSKEFPMMVEIIDGPVGNYTFYNMLMPGIEIIIHGKYQADRIIASEIRSYYPKKHFLIPSSYKGKFKRKARMFRTAYDLKVAKQEAEELHVVATKAFHSPMKEFSSLCVGDQLVVHEFQSREILYDGKKTLVDVLICTKKEEVSSTQVTIPLYVEGDFIEVVHDKRKYYISELCKHFKLPLNVKVSVRDLFVVGEDVLATTSMLHLEEQITDSYLLVSLLNTPDVVWELPVHRLQLSAKLIGKFEGKTFSTPTRTNIEEINEEDYYMVRRFENQVQYPPPRPPKTPLYASMPSEPETSLPDLKINLEEQVYADRLPLFLFDQLDETPRIGLQFRKPNLPPNEETGVAPTLSCKCAINHSTEKDNDDGVEG